MLELPLLFLLAPATGGPLFTDISGEVGLAFVHDPGVDGSYFMPESMGSGGAFLDYDADGDLDVYLIQAGPHSASSTAGNRLFRQEKTGKFTDVTDASGLGDTGYGMGVAVGDIDNDGLLDVYVTNYGRDTLYRNDGEGAFEDITPRSGVSGDLWSASAVFCDYDRDGFLDLFVTQYVRYDPGRTCKRDDGSLDYCEPEVFPGTPDTLYHNEGGGRFTDVSRQSGIGSEAAAGLGVLCFDYNHDGWVDFLVANDGDANHLWENQGNGRFIDRALLQGVALNQFGRPEAGMGVAVGDVDGDGRLDALMTHLSGETNTLYLGSAVGFRDGTASGGLAAPSLPWTGFGTGFLDYDHDGYLDLAVVNGRVGRRARLPEADVGEYWNPYAEVNQIFRNDGGGRFEDVSASAGAFASRPEVSRGLALGDVDNDGDLDILVTHTAGPARLYRNDAPKTGHWLRVRLAEPVSGRGGYGALVTVVSGQRNYRRIAHPGFSYLSSSDSRVHFGLPEASADRIEVVWPDGAEEVFSGGPVDREVLLERHGGEARR